MGMGIWHCVNPETTLFQQQYIDAASLMISDWKRIEQEKEKKLVVGRKTKAPSSDFSFSHPFLDFDEAGCTSPDPCPPIDRFYETCRTQHFLRGTQIGGENSGNSRVDKSFLKMGEEAQTSPKNRIKLVCSHGGRILPRPSDGQLKYVGGETRVVAVPRSITFSELKKKLNSLVEGDMVLKYQMMPEDLDALVSVKSDEDLKHMIDEYDRQGGGGSPRFRAFLFPPTPYRISNHHSSTTHSNTDDSNSMEQRYIDAINGVVRTNSNASTSRPTGTISSAGSSPRSFAPDSSAASETGNQESVLYDGFNNPSRTFGGIRSSPMQGMHKVHSSPSLFSLGQQHNHQQQQQQKLYHQQQYSNQVRAPPRLPVSPRISPRDGGQQQSRYYYEASHQKATGACAGCCGHMDGLRAGYRNGGFGDPDSMAQLSMKQMGAEGSKWTHGLDYRER